MREVTGYAVNAANEKLKIEVTDEPGAGGANHRYVVSGFNSEGNKSRPDGDDAENEVVILFQNGTIPENGVNGLTQEVLLAIVIDRLRSFQAGKFSSRENALALTNIETGLLWLQKRTIDRLARGVEGTHKI